MWFNDNFSNLVMASVFLNFKDSIIAAAQGLINILFPCEKTNKQTNPKNQACGLCTTHSSVMYTYKLYYRAHILYLSDLNYHTLFVSRFTLVGEHWA